MVILKRHRPCTLYFSLRRIHWKNVIFFLRVGPNKYIYSGMRNADTFVCFTTSVFNSRRRTNPGLTLHPVRLWCGRRRLYVAWKVKEAFERHPVQSGLICRSQTGAGLDAVWTQGSSKSGQSIFFVCVFNYLIGILHFPCTKMISQRKDLKMKHFIAHSSFLFRYSLTATCLMTFSIVERSFYKVCHGCEAMLLLWADFVLLGCVCGFF